MSSFALQPQELLQAVFEHVGVAILVVNDEGRIVYANRVVYSILGKDRDLPGMRIQDLSEHFRFQDSSGRDIPLSESAVMRVLAGELHVESRDLRLMLPDGRCKWLHNSVHRFSIMGLSGVLVIMTDETTEVEFRRVAEQIDRLEILGTLAKTLAVDFNNVLQAIQSNAYLALSDASVPQPVRARLQHISGATQKASTLVRRLMQFGRTQELRVQPLQLNNLVSDVLHLLGPLLESEILVQTNLTPNLPMIEADLGQMEQVLVNLVLNSIEAMPDGGRLDIVTEVAEFSSDVRSAEERIVVSIADNGIGISEESQRRIFEPFYTTKPAGESTGLGLSSVYGIVRQHGGDIRVKSKPGEGAKFTISLPTRKLSLVIQSPAIQSVA
jgi:two-component system cell cycle sensor histidine kinase/response regulator CckA